MITLASREFRVLLTILLTSLRCLRIFGFVGVAWFTLVRSLYWVLGFCGVRPGYCCVGDDRCADYAPILLLALHIAAVVAVFSPVSRFLR